ncbi:6-phosphogluconolactonase [Actinopolymorpha sp. B11F2]|uniref:6-phosphogluconolactonase n=1 Tax=Actinopolymorpha sp. B11F2 TaxID=3160862 RepID=UPI0032E36F2D
MSTPEIVVHATKDLLAEAIAARLVTALVDVQASRTRASVVLTGGGIGTGSLAAVANSPARDAIDWRRLDVWWGDERFLPTGDPERNETGARAALLDHVPVDPARIHAMPSADEHDAARVEAAAERYASELAAAVRPEDHGPVPAFDICMLGVGPDGHVASLFPERPAVYDERPVVGVHGAPKPPPTRISLTFPALNAAREVWFLVSGAEKAGAVRLALSGAGPVQIPAAGVRGRQRTLWLLDRAAAKELPADLHRPTTP